MYDLKDKRWIINRGQLEFSPKKVVLTFDDGPSRQLATILTILKEKKVPAHFFWQSRLLHPKRPWQRVIEEGHVIGSHGINHKNFAKLTYKEQFKQIKNSVAKIEQVTGRKVRYFRPPYGQYNEDTLKIVAELQLIPVMWEISSYDWEKQNTPQQVISNVVNHSK